MIFPNFNTAYISTLKELMTKGDYVPSVTDPFSIGSNFGFSNKDTIELIGYEFSITDPTSRLCSSKSRSMNLIFSIANALWTAAGRDDLKFIEFYNQVANKLSDDGQTLAGSHGKRIFSSQTIDQFAYIRERLTQDRYSRRAYISIYQPVDNISLSKDIPCLAGLQFLVRKDKLNMVCSMRSQSAAMVMPYDIFSFTFLQEVMSIELGIGIGAYYHFCSSFHVYKDEIDLVDLILKEDINSIPPTPKMPSDISPFKIIKEILNLEHALRQASSQSDFDNIIKDAIFAPFWKDYLLILAIHIAKVKNLGFNFFHQINPFYQIFIGS